MSTEEKLPTEAEIIKELDERVKQLEKEKEEYFNGLQRAKADLLRAQKELEEKAKFLTMMANESLIVDILPILDSFDLAVGSLTEVEKESQVGKGYYLIQSQLTEVLHKYGLNVIEAKNQKFNPQYHEAISTKSCDSPDCSGDDDGLIVEVLAKGYLYHGKVIRPAKVKVVTH